MGMYDEIKCEYPLPSTPKSLQRRLFQTKDLENLLEIYTIARNGKLIHHVTKLVSVPEKKRPFYGKPEWKKPWGKSFGSMKQVQVRDEAVPHHGDVTFYTHTGSHEKKNLKWYEYVARFTHGKVEYIKRVK